MALCDYCDALNFKAVGLHGQDSTGYEMFSEECELKTVLDNAGRCFFCKKMADFFNCWAAHKLGRLEGLSINDARVDVGTYQLRSEENTEDGGIDAALVRISVSYTLRKPDSEEGWFGPSLYFQKCAPQPMHVSAMFDEPSELDWPKQEPYSGRIRPQRADTRLFQKWRRFCMSTHTLHCGETYTGRKPPKVRLIDVRQKCVVEVQEDVKWVALSYVWGHVESLVLKKHSLELFQQPGFFTESIVPPTLYDAMVVTMALGERYLWVDRFCIIQDDEADKSEYIPHMDSIYGLASLTIIDAAGADAHHGLPGIRPSSRSEEQIPFEVKGVSLVQTLDPAGTGDQDGYLADSTWNTRGWTFQEGILSDRALIFTTDQVYWQCQEATWCEDGFWEQPNSPTIYRHNFDNSDFRKLWDPDIESFDRKYRKLVEKYTGRALTDERDGLDAFAGILAAFERATGQRFLWGLPASFLGVALTWPCDHSTLRRTSMATFRTPGGTVSPCPFPSWSWVGWVGEIYFDELFGILDSEPVGLDFYTLGSDGSPELIYQNTTFRRREILFPTAEREPSNALWKDGSRTVITASDIPVAIFSQHIAPAILCFWTSTAALAVEHGAASHFGDPVPMLSHKDVIIHGLWSHVPRVIGGKESEYAKFIVIGRDSLEDIREKNRISVLMVDEDSDGVSYRRGLVTVDDSDWIALDNRIWQPVVLG